MKWVKKERYKGRGKTSSAPVHRGNYTEFASETRHFSSSHLSSVSAGRPSLLCTAPYCRRLTFNLTLYFSRPQFTTSKFHKFRDWSEPKYFTARVYFLFLPFSHHQDRRRTALCGICCAAHRPLWVSAFIRMVYVLCVLSTLCVICICIVKHSPHDGIIASARVLRVSHPATRTSLCHCYHTKLIINKMPNLLSIHRATLIQYYVNTHISV